MQDSTPHSPALPAAPAQNPPAHVYYPSEVLAIVDAALAKQQRPLVSVRGAYRRRGKQGCLHVHLDFYGICCAFVAPKRV